MKKSFSFKKWSFVEDLGFSSLFLWAGVTYIRNHTFVPAGVFLTIINSLPNLYTAFGVVALGKAFIQRLLHKTYSLKTHNCICATVGFCALLYKTAAHFLSNRPFDFWDILFTLLALGILLIVPQLLAFSSNKA